MTVKSLTAKVFRRARVADAEVPPKDGATRKATAKVKQAAATTAQAAANDRYEEHQPAPTKLSAQVDRVLDKIAPIRTHERVLYDVGGSVFGVEVGITLSQLELVKKNTGGVELIQVVNADGSANVETVLGRKHLTPNMRIELQGPALNSSVTPGELPLGARFIGVGLTSDVTSAMDHDAVSYTAEVKLTTKSILELAVIGGASGGAAAAAEAVKELAGGTVGHVLGEALVGAVPVLSAVLAVASARRAIHVVRDEHASKPMKVFAVAHAVADAVRVVFPLAGTLANVGLVGAAAALGWVHHRHAKHAAPTGPPPDDGPGKT